MSFSFFKKIKLSTGYRHKRVHFSATDVNTWVFKIKAEDISERWNPSIFKNLCTSDTANQTADANKIQPSDEVYLLTLHCRWRMHSSPRQSDVQSVISFLHLAGFAFWETKSRLNRKLIFESSLPAEFTTFIIPKNKYLLLVGTQKLFIIFYPMFCILQGC